MELTDHVEVTSTVTKIGTSSFATTSVIATSEGHRCATVRTVQVALDDTGGGSRPWTDDERAVLERLLAPSA